MADVGCPPTLTTTRVTRITFGCLAMDYVSAAPGVAESYSRSPGQTAEYARADTRTEDQDG